MSEASLEPWAEVLRKRRTLDKPWLILPKSPGLSSECRTVSYHELEGYAVRAAQAIRALGDQTLRVAIIADSSMECCACIFGVLLSDLTLVPVAPRSLGRPHAAWKRDVEALLRDCSPALLLGSEADVRELEPGPGIVVASYAALLNAAGGRGGRRAGFCRDLSSIALWQHTSGTTGAARAVALSHANILQNISCIGNRIEVSERDVGATWLPLFHDMGLMGSLLFAAYWGMSLVLMPPRTFVARPEAWLWAISRFRVTCSAAPNSAYEICASKVAASKLSGLDLSCWRVAFNGAEFVHAATVQRFCARFAEHGFRADAMYPVYGLAEHTVAATLPDALRGAQFDWVDGAKLESAGKAVSVVPGSMGARAITAVGKPLPRHALRLVDTQGNVISEERLVGEIQLHGPSRMQGYGGRVDAFAPGGWLQTGDLGYLADANLHIVGRSKHLIKRGGRWVDAALIECAARVIDGVRGGVVAAFGVPDNEAGTERLVVLAETAHLAPGQQQQMRREIARAVVEAAAVAPDVIDFVLPGSIPRTTSGKVQHSAARQKYLEANG